MQLTHSRRKIGLTLVEILVVIAIIMILAGLVNAVAQQAIKSAKTTSCTSNLSQLGKAMDFYVADNGGYIPPYFQESLILKKRVIEGRSDLIKKALEEYGASDPIFYCPLDESRKKDEKFIGSYKRISSIDTSYVYGHVVEFWYRSDKSVPYLKFRPSDVDRPSDFILLGDMPQFKGNESSHGKFYNCLYLDGHVKLERNTSVHPYFGRSELKK